MVNLVVNILIWRWGLYYILFSTFIKQQNVITEALCIDLLVNYIVKFLYTYIIYEGKG